MVRKTGPLIREHGPIVLRDLAGLAGAGVIAYGAWSIYPPAGWIAGGILMLAASLLLAIAGK